MACCKILEYPSVKGLTAQLNLHDGQDLDNHNKIKIRLGKIWAKPEFFAAVSYPRRRPCGVAINTLVD